MIIPPSQDACSSSHGCFDPLEITWSKRLLTHTLKLNRERGDDRSAAHSLRHLCDANRGIGLCEEGIKQVEEASAIFKRLGNRLGEARCLMDLGPLFYSNHRFDAAEEAVSHTIALLPQKGEQSRVCEAHRILGRIYQSKGEMRKAINHFEIALGIASSFGWNDLLFLVHYDLAYLFFGEGRFDDGQAHIERAKSYAVNQSYYLGLVMELQARLWCKQHRLEEARAEALCAFDLIERLGAAKSLKRCRMLLERIEKEMDKPAIPKKLTAG